MATENVYAPIDGKVTHVDAENGIITVYVAKTDSHIIYAPTSGTLTNTVEENGLWVRPGTFNVPDQTKTGRLVLCMKTTNGRTYEFWVEVGHGKYITDTIRLDIRAGDTINEKSSIGEIVIGSLYEMHLKSCRVTSVGRRENSIVLPQLVNTVVPNVKPGDVLSGGVSIVASLQ